MNEHQMVSCFNHGKMSIHPFSSSSPDVNLLSCLGCLSDKNGVMIGQIACQSNSLHRVNWASFVSQTRHPVSTFTLGCFAKCKCRYRIWEPFKRRYKLVAWKKMDIVNKSELSIKNRSANMAVNQLSFPF